MQEKKLSCSLIYYYLHWLMANWIDLKDAMFACHHCLRGASRIHKRNLQTVFSLYIIFADTCNMNIFFFAVEVRRSLHLRLGLPFDRPLLRIANAINLSSTKENMRDKTNSKGKHLISWRPFKFLFLYLFVEFGVCFRLSFHY